MHIYVRFFRAAVILLFVSVAATVEAEDAVSSSYPWDTTFQNCATESHPSGQGCISDDWPTFSLAVQRIAFLYRSEQFSLLERAMTELTKTDKAFVDGYPAASAVYWAFRRMMPGSGAKIDEQGRIQRWKNAVPNSYFAVFAEARYLYASAWSVRGSGYASSVSPESWELFSLKLRNAERTLLEAPQPLKDTPLWDNLLLAISLDSSEVESKPQDVFENAVRRWPRYYDFYEVMLSRLVPKWGGSWEKVEAFIDKWSGLRKAHEGESLYARLYISLLNQGVTPDKTVMKWETMRTGLGHLVSRYPDTKFKNLYASYACFARDRPTFNKAMGQLPKSELVPDHWISGHSYEACIRWAVI